MLTPFYMLKGTIQLVKEIRIDNKLVEKWYRDETGAVSIVVVNRPV